MRIERLPLLDESDEYLNMMQLLRRRYSAVCEAAFFAPAPERMSRAPKLKPVSEEREKRNIDETRRSS
jgi:hypothetical protein